MLDRQGFAHYSTPVRLKAQLVKGFCHALQKLQFFQGRYSLGFYLRCPWA